MSSELLIALISGVVALIAAALAIWGQLRSTQLGAKLQALGLAEEARLKTEEAMAGYREPLARAAFELQSRLYNILEKHLFMNHFDKGNERERTYVIDNTAFLVAQYLAWTEIIRRDIQYIDLGQDGQTRDLAHLQEKIHVLFLTDRFERTFRIFAGEQRAIGERMIRDATKGPECIGYAAFLTKLAQAPDPLLDYVREDARQLSTMLQTARPRLVALQNALIDLLAFLDPDFIRFPKERRAKVVE